MHTVPPPDVFASPPPPHSATLDVNRPPRFWHAAFNATKGLFNNPSSRPSLEDDLAIPAPVPRAEDRRMRVRRSTSSPALKTSASTGNLRRDMMADQLSPPLPHTLFTNRSHEPSPRKPRFKAASAKSAAARRPVISPPSLPKPLDSLAFSHPKLAYPLSPTPSPVGSTFSMNSEITPASSKLHINRSQSDDAASINADAFSDSRPVRRRTKSAPGSKFGKRTLDSPALSVAPEPETILVESSSPVVIDIASPSTASFDSGGSAPSPPLETPTMGSEYFIHTRSPLAQTASPRSFTSVKRKPVPRYLYMDPPEHDASAPCTPVLTPNPGSPYAANVSSKVTQSEALACRNVPLLSSSELILQSCNPSRTNVRGLNLLPIGQGSMDSSGRKQHRRSVSEQGYNRLLSPTANIGLPSPWFTTNASGSMTPLVTPAEEQTPFSFDSDFYTAPRVLPRSRPQTPTYVAEEVSAFSDNTSVCSSVSTNGALSPLTDDEIDALRSFLRRNAAGHRARQRRKASKFEETHSRSSSVASSPYDMHAQILESYGTDEDEFFSLGESEDDADAESHMPVSASETRSVSTASIDEIHQEHALCGERGEYTTDSDVETPVIRDEIETPVDAVNRGTFGYGTPIVRRQPSQQESVGFVAYIAGIDDCSTRLSFPSQWTDAENMENDIQAKKTRNRCRMDAPEVIAVGAPPRSSSLYYRASAESAQHSDDEDNLSYLRSSRQPLVPRALNSESESDRPLSTSSTSTSLSPSLSTGPSTFASGIGLAIIPPEHFAHFDKFENYKYGSPCSPSECGSGTNSDGSPTTLACASSSSRSQQHAVVLCDGPSDKLQANLADIQTQTTSFKGASYRNGLGFTSSVLKPALQINADRSTLSMLVQLPSPTDTIETYPHETFTSGKPRPGQKSMAQGKVRWTEAATPNACADERIPDNVKSFMNLTPNDPAPKRSRVKLRQLFSRANLKSVAGRKVPTESKR